MNSVKLVLKIRCTHFGFVRKWKVNGVCSSTFTKRTFLLQQIFVSKLIDFYRLKMITRRKFLLSRLGFCEAGAMLFILENSCNLLLTLVLSQENCSESFMLHKMWNWRSLFHLMCNIGILQINIPTSLTFMQLSSKLLIQLELGL